MLKIISIVPLPKDNLRYMFYGDVYNDVATFKYEKKASSGVLSSEVVT